MLLTPSLSLQFCTEALHTLEEHIANRGLPNDPKTDQVSRQGVIVCYFSASLLSVNRVQLVLGYICQLFFLCLGHHMYNDL